MGSNNMEILTNGYSEVETAFGSDITHEDLNELIVEENGKMKIDMTKYDARLEDTNNHDISAVNKSKAKQAAEDLNKDERLHTILTSA
jgi:hypothetical protein